MDLRLIKKQVRKQVGRSRYYFYYLIRLIRLDYFYYLVDCIIYQRLIEVQVNCR